MKNIDDKNRFKPHLVEIEDRPVSPLGRKVLWSILIFMAISVFWLFWGKTDIVVSARSQVIPMGDVKVLQPIAVGSVRKIYVKEGDLIKKGDPLIEIDPSVEETNIEAKKKTLELLELEASKLRSLIDNKPFIMPSNTSSNLAKMIEGTYKSEKESIKEQKNQLKQKEKQLNEMIKSATIDRDRISQLYDMGVSEQKRLESVLDIIAKKDYYQIKKQNMSYKSEVNKLTHEIQKLKDQLLATQMQENLLDKDSKSKYYKALSQKEKEITAYRSDIQMTEFKMKKQIIASPVDGIVGKIEVNTIGAVVTPAEKLITIIPKDVPIRLKAIVENKDIGFIKKGMRVAIKIDTFNFQRFGLIEGIVTKIGANAIKDEKLGLVYEVFIEPLTTSLMVEGEKRYIMPGMSATSELKVGKRRIIELFVYPLIKYFNEGVSVR